MVLPLVLAASLAASPTESDPKPPAPAAAPVAEIGEVDLKPIFAEPPLSRALEAFEDDRFEEAARGFARSDRPEARYLRGVALVSAHHGREAVAALAPLASALPAIADRVHWWTGQALDEAKDHRSAAAAYARIPDGSVLWPEGQLARARDFEALGNRDAALEALEPILTLPAPSDLARRDAAAAALLLTGELRARGRDKGEIAWARRAFVECWAGHPIAPEARECLASLKRLPAPANALPAEEDRLRYAESLLELNRNDLALAELARLVPKLPEPGPDAPFACRARFALGKALRRERHHSTAMSILRPVAERCTDPGVRVRALYVLASAAAVAAPADGIEDYRRLARDFPGHPYADDALFFAADLLVHEGRRDEAKKGLAELAERYPKGDYRSEALFRLAWISKQEGDIEAAIASLARLEAEYRDVDPYEHARAAYWRARLLASRAREGDRSQARDLWGSLAIRYPADYYGLLARARLQENRLPGEAAAPDAPAAIGPAREPVRYALGPLASDPHFRAGLLLLRMGLGHAAADELNAVDRKALSPGASGDEGAEPVFLLADLLDRAGDHRSAHQLIRTLGRAALRHKPDGPNERLWRVAYPAAFRAEVLRYAPGAGVPADLLQALMREESALDPKIVSPAGAVGLTQLMLPTARSVARRLRMGRLSQADLMRAPVNIRIGAAYLGDLLRRFGGSAPLAVAAYNAGDGAVRAWLKLRGDLAMDEFVEEIPYQETRGYVKRVLRSYAAYRLLYGRPAERVVALSQELPAAK